MSRSSRRRRRRRRRRSPRARESKSPSRARASGSRPRAVRNVLAGQPTTSGKGPEGRNRVVRRPRDDENCAVLVTGEGTDEELEPDRERERLVRVLPTERHELLGRRAACEHVTVRDRAHGHVRDEGVSFVRRDRDCERVRPGERRAAPPVGGGGGGGGGAGGTAT